MTVRVYPKFQSIRIIFLLEIQGFSLQKYQAPYLSANLYPEQKEIFLSCIASHSVMSWAHINLLGEYDFSDEKLKDSLNIRPLKLVSCIDR